MEIPIFMHKLNVIQSQTASNNKVFLFREENYKVWEQALKQLGHPVKPIRPEDKLSMEETDYLNNLEKQPNESEVYLPLDFDCDTAIKIIESNNPAKAIKNILLKQSETKKETATQTPGIYLNPKLNEETNLMENIQTKQKNNNSSQVSEKLDIEAEIAKINAKFQQLVDAEMANITAETINYSDLGCDLDEVDLTKILVVNGEYTSNMTLEDKQQAIVQVIQELGEDSPEYQMAVTRRVELTKAKRVNELKSKITKKTGQIAKDVVNQGKVEVTQSGKKVFGQAEYIEAASEIAAAEGDRLYNKLMAKRQKDRDRVYKAIDRGVTAAVTDRCYKTYLNSIINRANTVAKLSGRLISDAMSEGKIPASNAQDYAEVLANVTEAMKDENPSVLPNSDLEAINSQIEAKDVDASQETVEVQAAAA